MRGRHTFRQTGAVVTGSITVVVMLAFAAFGTFYPSSGWPAWLVAGALLLAAVAYVAQLRPAVVLTDTDLVLRDMLSTVRVPLAAVRTVDVAQLLSVEVGGEIYDNPAVGRSRRQIKRDAALPVEHHLTEDSYGLVVEHTIRERAAAARRARGVAEDSREQRALAAEVRRVRAWPEIALLALAVLGFVLAIAL